MFKKPEEKNIIFSNVWPLEQNYPPVPAIKLLPDWFTKSESEIPDSYIKHLLDTFGYPSGTNGTVKRCTPVLDAMGAGYILRTSMDVIVTQKEKPYYNWPLQNIEVIGFHPAAQVQKHPLVNTEFVPKWMNPWSIKTPKGYSTLFIHPMHRDDLMFTVLPGIVDTDSYFAPVHPLFVLKDPNFEGLIPAGTPFCQVVPFKREEWYMQLNDKETLQEAAMQIWRTNKLPELRYKIAHWTRKHFK
jgi:hypothetical protein